MRHRALVMSPINSDEHDAKHGVRSVPEQPTATGHFTITALYPSHCRTTFALPSIRPVAESVAVTVITTGSRVDAGFCVNDQ